VAIKALHIGNFKGIATAERIEIKPITRFIGPNSSGKSSCIHALASLSQTVKLPNDTRSLSLDDEFASVHLGRFIEVIHSRSYSGEILLGLELKGVSYTRYEKILDKRTSSHQIGEGRAEYSFKCSKRTQEVYLDTARHSIGTLNFHAQRAGDTYEVTEETGETVAMLSLERGFCLTSR
jgi:AAA15 family ATPase/GTPase